MPMLHCGDGSLMNLQDKYRTLRQILNNLQRVVVAYSGGVDSTFLLKAAVDTIGRDNVLACIGISPSLTIVRLSISTGHC